MDTVLARRVKLHLAFNGVDVSEEVEKDLLSLTYTDNEDGEADDLQMELQDRACVWLENWLDETVDAAASETLKIDASITRQGWEVGDADWTLPCGSFSLDTADCNGPPGKVLLKASSLASGSAIGQTKKSRAWENVKLSAIAAEIAGNGGLSLCFESQTDPFYSRKTQSRTSDAVFLKKLCDDAGLSFKCSADKLIIFEQSAYEKQPPCLILERDGGRYIRRRLSVSTAGTQYASCRVRYMDPSNGQCIEGVARVDDYDEKSESRQQLEVNAKVRDAGEAKALAEKRLRLHNKYSRTASFTLPGNPGLAAGLTVELRRFGGWNGIHLISKAKHSVGPSGYTTELTLRKVLSGY